MVEKCNKIKIWINKISAIAIILANYIQIHCHWKCINSSHTQTHTHTQRGNLILSMSIWLQAGNKHKIGFMFCYYCCCRLYCFRRSIFIFNTAHFSGYHENMRIRIVWQVGPYTNLTFVASWSVRRREKCDETCWNLSHWTGVILSTSLSSFPLSLHHSLSLLFS